MNATEYLIKHEKLDLRIRLHPSDSLLLHEETIPYRVAELKESFKRDTVVKDPIIVDDGSSVVLDGMHRVAALRELGCMCVPVCAVDYSDPSIKVAVWYRALIGSVSPDQFQAALSSLGIKIERYLVDKEGIKKTVPPSTLFASGECLRLSSCDLGSYQIVKTTEGHARDLGLTIVFETEHDALEKLLNTKVDAIITVPSIDKKSVREAGLMGRLYPHKLTRHIIPARPLGVNTPLATLIDEKTTLKEKNQRFVANLQARGIVRNTAGAIIEGRRYEEETFIFK